MTQLLTDEFIGKYPDFPEHMNELGKFVYYRTYSRWLPEIGRRETWKETCRRATEYNVGLAIKHYEKIGYAVPYVSLQVEAEGFFDGMFNLRRFLSGRTLWVGGTEAGERYSLSQFNCSFINIRSWSDLGDLFYLLMVGCGVGFKCTKEFAAGLAPVRTSTTLINAPYEPVPVDRRLETKVQVKARFRAYNNYGEAIDDHFALLKNPRYVNAGVWKAKTPREFAEAVKRGGYATDPNYVTLIMSIVNGNKLTRFDKPVAPVVPVKKIEEAVELALKEWQLQLADKSIDNLAAKSMLSDAAEWKERLRKEPQKVIEDMPWLVFVLADRASGKAGA